MYLFYYAILHWFYSQEFHKLHVRNSDNATRCNVMDKITNVKLSCLLSAENKIKCCHFAIFPDKGIFNKHVRRWNVGIFLMRNLNVEPRVDYDVIFYLKKRRENRKRGSKLQYLSMRDLISCSKIEWSLEFQNRFSWILEFQDFLLVSFMNVVEATNPCWNKDAPNRHCLVCG